ncbi:MAG: SurA N-terminal domain-containing protein [Pacificimonas sp.]
MLSLLRRGLKNPIVLALFALVLVAFVIVGMGDPLGGGVASDTVAEVGDREISQNELGDQFDRTVDLLRAENSEITTEQAAREGGVQATLERMIASAALRVFGDELGIGASKRMVDAEIAQTPAFQGPDGNFSETTYRQVLTSQRLSEEFLRESLRDDLVRRQLLSVLASPTPVPDGIAEPIALYQLEQRTLSLGAVPFQAFADASEPSAEEVEAYYQENIARFTVPERRRFRYALIDGSSMAAEADISDAEIRDFFERSDDLYGERSTRSLRQAVAPDRAIATTLAERTRDGEDFAAVAAELLELTPADLELGTQSRDQLAVTVNDELADAVYAAEAEGVIVGPIQSDFGWHVASVDMIEVTPARPLAEVRDDIETRLRADAAEARMADLIGEAEDAFADGASLTEVADELGLEVQSPPALLPNGQTPDDPSFAMPERAAPLVDAAFEFGADEEPVAVDLAPNLFALLDVEEEVAPAPVPLDAIREQVTSQFVLQRQIDAAEAAAAEIVAAVEGGADLGAELSSRNLPPVQPFTARRIELSAQQQQQVPAAIVQGFNQSEGDIRPVTEPARGAVLIVRTDDIVPGRLADAPTFLATVKSQLREASARELQDAFARAVSDEVGVERFPDAINELEARYLNVGLGGL